MFIEKVRMPAKGAFSLENTERLRVHLHVILTGSNKGKKPWNINTFAFVISHQALRDPWTIHIFQNRGWQAKDQNFFQPGDKLGFLRLQHEDPAWLKP